MHVGWKIAGAVGLVGAGALALAACSSEKSPNEFAMDEFGKFDRSPKDNKWTSGETSMGYVEKQQQLVNTYRVGDARFGTWQFLERDRTDSMNRIYDAAKGNDAILSLEELTNFAVSKFDADKNGTLNRGERKDFETAYGATQRYGQWHVTGTAPYVDWDYYERDYPSNPGNGGTSGGDDSGWPGGNPGNGGTSGGDDGGYIPPSGGNNGGTSGGDDGGSYTPPSNGGGYTPPSTGGGNSTDNGNPSEDDF